MPVITVVTAVARFSGIGLQGFPETVQNRP